MYETKGHIAKTCKIALHLVKVYKKYGKQRDTHTAHVEHTDTLCDEMAINPFENMISYAIFGDNDPNIINVSLLLDSAIIGTILCYKKYFFYLDHVMRNILLPSPVVV